MSSQTGLSPDLDEILKDGGARNSGLSYDNATPAEDNVVSNLHKVIETRTGANHRISRRSSIDRRIGAHLDIIFQNHSTKLGSGQKTFFSQRKSKSFLSDPRARIYVHARAQ